MVDKLDMIECRTCDGPMPKLRKELSNKAAARYLRVSYVHYKKYALTYIDEETGLSLLEVHKNRGGKGIPKFLLGKSSEPKLIDVLEGRVPMYHFSPQKIKDRILEEGLIDPECSNCKFRERRLIDQRLPLILTHINGEKTDFGLDNLEFLCYNCAFLYGKSPITDDQVEIMEGYKEVAKRILELEQFSGKKLEYLELLDYNQDSSDQSDSKYKEIGAVRELMNNYGPLDFDYIQDEPDSELDEDGSTEAPEEDIIGYTHN
jgi:hypothetical protein